MTEENNKPATSEGQAPQTGPAPHQQATAAPEGQASPQQPAPPAPDQRVEIPASQLAQPQEPGQALSQAGSAEAPKPTQQRTRERDTFDAAKAPLMGEDGGLSVGGKALWFFAGFIGGIFGWLAAWLASGFWPEKARRDVLWAASTGFLAEAVITLIALNSGMLDISGTTMSAFDSLSSTATTAPEGTSPAFG